MNKDYSLFIRNELNLIRANNLDYSQETNVFQSLSIRRGIVNFLEEESYFEIWVDIWVGGRGRVRAMDHQNTRAWMGILEYKL